jgi:hypothetical protein
VTEDEIQEFDAARNDYRQLCDRLRDCETKRRLVDDLRDELEAEGYALEKSIAARREAVADLMVRK